MEFRIYFTSAGYMVTVFFYGQYRALSSVFDECARNRGIIFFGLLAIRKISKTLDECINKKNLNTEDESRPFCWYFASHLSPILQIIGCCCLYLLRRSNVHCFHCASVLMRYVTVNDDLNTLTPHRLVCSRARDAQEMIARFVVLTEKWFLSK